MNETAQSLDTAVEQRQANQRLTAWLIGVPLAVLVWVVRSLRIWNSIKRTVSFKRRCYA